jgi:TQXA domain-containing protein
MTIDRDSRFAWSLTWRRIASAVALTAALLATALRGAPALAAEATLTSLGVGLYDTVTGTTGGPFYMPDFVGSFHVSIDGGPTTEAYCVDIQHALTFGEPQPQVVPDYPPEVLYILRNAYPNPGTIGTPLADLTREAAAVQSAIWFFTDGFVITGPPDVQGRAVEIIEAAQEQCGEAATALHARTFLPVEEQCGPLPAVPNELTLSPAEATNYLPDQDSHTVTATLRDSQGQAIAGHDIEVVIAGAAGPQTFQGVTDAQGDFVVTYQNSLQVPGVDTITATAAFTAPVGLEFKAEGNQGIAIAGPPRPGTVTGTATKHWVPAACGDGVVNQAGEQCDDGNLVDDDGCDRNCTPTACGNGIVTSGELCDDGNLLDGDGCDGNCTPTACGNGIVTVGEECDDGNTVNGDGCDNNCTVTSCGNGVAGPGEECDDGNATNGDGCDVNCTVSACSNGIVAGGEQCDDGNLVDGDGCDSNCTVTACGNGIVTAGEQCDDGNAVNGDGCDSNCTVTGCGNGIVTEGEQCDDGNLVDGDGCNSDCTAPVCGDGVVTEGEQCDDGNLVDGDGCDSNCTVTGCGNGIVSEGEECDDGNLVDGDACDSNCTVTGCGNGIVTAGEQCDDGNLVDGDGCDSNCTVTGCGNGIVTEGEQCDDGNLVDGDLCESDCTAARCGNGIVDQGEQCDDGNFQDGDGCDGMCRLQEICTNGIDDDGDGAIDCDDTDCACLPILRDPAVIRFSHTRPASSRARQRPDLLRVHGRIEPGTAHDAVAEGLTLLVTNAHGVVYKARLLPGDLQRRKSGMSFVDKAAARGAGTRDGLYRVRLRRGINDSLVVSIEAYGDLSAATLPAMTIQIGIGDDMFYTKGAFSSRRYGWYWAF